MHDASKQKSPAAMHLLPGFIKFSHFARFPKKNPKRYRHNWSPLCSLPFPSSL